MYHRTNHITGWEKVRKKCGEVQSWYIAFYRHPDSRHLRRLVGWRYYLYKAMQRLWDGNHRMGNVFSHVVAFRHTGDTAVMLSFVPGGHVMSIAHCSPADLVQEILLEKRLVALVYYEATLTADEYKTWKVQSGSLCHTHVRNFLFIDKNIRTPFKLWEYLIKNGGQEIKGFNYGRTNTRRSCWLGGIGAFWAKIYKSAKISAGRCFKGGGAGAKCATKAVRCPGKRAGAPSLSTD